MCEIRLENVNSFLIIMSLVSMIEKDNEVILPIQDVS